MTYFNENFKVEAGKITTTELVNKVFTFCELYSGIIMYPYQEQFGKRVIRSVLTNDGDEITALFARQSGKSETIATVVGGMIIILPKLAQMPMFANDKRLQMFRDGLWVGIFAPSQRQAQITYGRMKARLQSKTARVVLEDEDFRLQFSTSNGQTVALTNGSFATAISASEGSSIEGESFKLIIMEECQDISNYKIRKSIQPMGASYNATLVKIGTATTFKGDFYDAIERNKRDYNNGEIAIKNHFEYDYKVVMKYNPKYEKYVRKEMYRLGEDSDEFQMSYCVTPQTKILTSDLRWVRADSIKKGDKLVGFDENPPKRYGQRKFKESIVEDTGVIDRPCYKVTLSDGTKVTCSEEHQWLVFTAGSRTVWKMTKDLVPTDRIYKVCDVWDDLPKDYELGYLSASFDGEGCLSRVNGKIQQLTFAQRDNVMLERVKQYLDKYSFDYNATYADKRKRALGQDLVYKLFIKGGKRELLRFLGSVRPKRLLDSFNPSNLGTVRCSNGDKGGNIHPNVTSLEYVGMQKVIPIRTSTRTYVAEGLASHNCLKWILQRGMFVDIDILEKKNGESLLNRVFSDMTKVHVAGIDLAGKDDSTVVTIVEVDWENPVISEEQMNEDTGELESFKAYNTVIKDWLEINGDDYNNQYFEILDYLKNFKMGRVMVDATKESSVAHRMRANLSYEVIPFIFSSRSKSDMYKCLDREIKSGRAKFPMSPEVVATREYKNFSKQLADLQKNYAGANMVVSHPPEKGAHDDYPDSWALAVLGTSEESDVGKVETQNSNPMYDKSGRSSFYTSRNNLTARRR